MTRRHFLAAGLRLTGLSAGAALLAACGGTATPPAGSGGSAAPAASSAAPSTSAAAARASSAAPAASASGPASSAAAARPSGSRAASISFGTGSVTNSMNPLERAARSEYYAVYDALTIVEPGKSTASPKLAESWKRVADDTVEFTLRQGVKFSDGTPLTAADVKFSYDTTINEKLAVLSFLSTVKEVQAPDDRTVRIITKAADPIIDKRASLQFIVPQAAYSKAGTANFTKTPIGTGKFVVKSFVPNQSLELEANPNAWEGQPATKSVGMKYYANPQTLQSAFESGQHDIAQLLPNQSLQQDADKFVIKAVLVGSPYIVKMDTTQGPFKDARVRKAVNLAIDREAIIKTVLLGAADPLNGQMAGPDCFGYDPDLKPFAYDVSQAKQLMKDAGVGNFNTEIAGLAKDQKLMEAIGGYLQAIGITVKVTALDTPVWAQQFYAGSPIPMFVTGLNYSPLYDVDVSYQWPTWPPKGTPNAHNDYIDPKWDAMLADERNTLDTNQRLKKLQDMAVYMNQQLPYLFLFLVKWPFGWTHQVQDFDPGAGFSMRLDQAWKPA